MLRLQSTLLVGRVPEIQSLVWRLVHTEPTSPSAHSIDGGVAKGCLTVLGVTILALIGGCFYFESRRPHFSGASPLAIDVRVRDLSSTNVYEISITNRTSCEAIVREFSQARPVLGAGKAVGEFTFHYDSGNTDVVWMLPGMPHGYYTIYLGGTFRMPSERFYQVLKEGGVDVSKIPRD